MRAALRAASISVAAIMPQAVRSGKPRAARAADARRSLLAHFFRKTE
jgi:hypothetical protein